jgi:Gpi18-like mannosyltransferase
LLLIFPTAFFFNTVYTESIFLFITLLTFFFTFKKDYLKAGIFGFLVALTRVNGILILVPVLYEFLADKTNNFKNIKSIFEEKNFLKFAALFLVVLAPLGFLAYHHIAFGDFWAFFNVQDAWGRSFALNGDHFVFGTSAAVSNFILDLLLVSFAIIVSIVALIKLRVSYGLYMLAVIALPLSTGTTASIGRYILVLFPMYILIASSKSIYTKLAYTFVSILLLAIVTLLFVSNSWAG